MYRKILLAISALLIFAVTAAPVLAAGSASISLSASSSTVNSGDTVTVTVSASVDSCGSGGIEISYDSGVFELLSGEWLLSGAFMTDFSTGSKDGVFAFDRTSAISGNVFRFTIKVKDGAALGSAAVTVKFKADGLSASKSASITVACAHTYSNSCDTSCNSCGAARTISHTWNSGKVIKAATCTATGTKQYTCNVCSATKTETISKSSHSYDNSCDTSCNGCGATRSISHSYAWVSSETEHWQECKVCGNKMERGDHTIQEALTGNEFGHGHICSVCGLMPDAKAHDYESDCDAVCEACGFSRTVTHSYSERWSYDTDGHWHECTICGEKLERTPHTPGDVATETTDQICTQCGYIIQVAGNHVHTMAGDWLSDEDGHWFLCACGAYTESEIHNWDDGTLDEDAGIMTYQCNDCAYVRTEIITVETVPEVQPQEETKNLPIWMVLAVLLAISVIGNIGLTIYIFVANKRRKPINV